jgi:hypothetical protein
VDDLAEATLALSTLVLADVSPDEVALVDAVGPELLEAADAGPGNDGALGFGGVETVFAMVVITVSKHVLTYLGEVVHDFAVDQGGNWLKRCVTAWQKKRAGDAVEAPLLSADEVARVRDVAFNSARTFGVDENRARLLADAMGGALGLGAPGVAPAT